MFVTCFGMVFTSCVAPVHVPDASRFWPLPVTRTLVNPIFINSFATISLLAMLSIHESLSAALYAVFFSSTIRHACRSVTLYNGAAVFNDVDQPANQFGQFGFILHGIECGNKRSKAELHGLILVGKPLQ